MLWAVAYNGLCTVITSHYLLRISVGSIAMFLSYPIPSTGPRGLVCTLDIIQLLINKFHRLSLFCDHHSLLFDFKKWLVGTDWSTIWCWSEHHLMVFLHWSNCCLAAKFMVHKVPNTTDIILQKIWFSSPASTTAGSAWK